MNFKFLNIVIALSIFVPQAYAGNAVSQISNGITFTAQVMSFQECNDTFGKNLHDDRIYPIRVSIRNDKHVPTQISIKSVKIPQKEVQEVLTPESILSSISFTSGAVGITAIIFFPIAFIFASHVSKLKDLLSIVQKHTMNDQTLTLNPGSSHETFIFPKYKYPETKYQIDEEGNRLRDAQGNLLPGERSPFVAPTSIDTAIEFVTDKSSNFTVNFNLLV